MEEPIIAPSAFKHGLDRDDILHAYSEPPCGSGIWGTGSP